MTIEEFAALSQACGNVEDLGRLFTRAIAGAGYQNVSFVRIDAKGYLALPYLEKPKGFVEIYVDERCEQSDPVLVEALKTGQPFYWNEIPLRRELSPGERHTVNVCRKVGAHSGLSIPHHGPDGAIDLINVSLRDEAKADTSAAAVARLVAMTSIMRWRYWQIRNELQAAASIGGVDVVHTGGPPGMTNARCQALVLIDIADRRRQIGLPHLSLQIGRHVADGDLAYLLSWGYVHDRPDDGSFRYQLAPTPLGSQDLATCEHARHHRRVAFELKVPRGARARFLFDE